MKIAGIIPDSIVDGPNIRTTVFLQGCPHHCPHCQNPETWDFAGGQQTTIKQLISDIIKATPFHAVTISGGEPFSQSTELLQVLTALKAKNYHICVFTGYTFEQICDNPQYKMLLPYIDILVDGRFIYEQRSLDLNFRGSANQRIIDVPASIANNYTAVLSHLN